MSTGSFLIDDQAFEAYLQGLAERGITEVAFDIEGEFNLHVYGERFCLLQLSDGSEEVAVDPFTVSSEAMASLLESETIAKITYDSASDRVLLAKTSRLRLRNIIDLKPAVDLLEFARRDLSSVLNEALGKVPSGSKRRFQQYNWTRRPIDPDAIDYALADVRYLIPLRDELFRRLQDQGLKEEYRALNARMEATEPKTNRKPGVFRSGRYRRLSREQQSEFTRLYEIRDRHARDLDLPPNTTVANNDLFALTEGRITVDEIQGNRRVPVGRLQRIREEMSRRTPPA